MLYQGDPGILGAIGGAIGGFLTGGPAGAIGGAVRGWRGEQRPRKARPRGGRLFAKGQEPLFYRPRGAKLQRQQQRVLDLRVNPPIFGEPGAGIDVTVGGVTVGAGVGEIRELAQEGVAAARRARVNGRGLPMVGVIGGAPDVEMREHRVCPTGQVLALDGNCYPRAMVPKSLRAWPPGRKPPIMPSDWKALQRAETVRNKVKAIASTAGYTTKKKGTGGKKKSA